MKSGLIATYTRRAVGRWLPVCGSTRPNDPLPPVTTAGPPELPPRPEGSRISDFAAQVFDGSPVLLLKSVLRIQKAARLGAHSPRVTLASSSGTTDFMRVTAGGSTACRPAGHDEHSPLPHSTLQLRAQRISLPGQAGCSASGVDSGSIHHRWSGLARRDTRVWE